jgi:hypothetical protein
VEKKEQGNSPFFGVNLGLESGVGGKIKRGDKVYVGK